MGLIEIKEFTGSEIGKAAMEALEMIGVVNKLNLSGYHITIEGIQGKTPKGMIDDTPSKHKVIFERDKCIGTLSKSEYKKIMDCEEQANALLNEQRQQNINFSQANNATIADGISRDVSGYMWYKHKVELNINSSALETTEGYVKRLFEETANYVINAFESMA